MSLTDKLKTIGKIAFQLALTTLPSAAGVAINHAAEALTTSQDPDGGKKAELADAKVVGSDAVAALNALSQSDLGANPKFQAIVRRVNESIYQAAKEIAELVDATDGVAGDGFHPPAGEVPTP